MFALLKCKKIVDNERHGLGKVYGIKTYIHEFNWYTDDIFSLLIHSPEICKNAHPGQFVMIRDQKWNFEPLFSRPMSIARVDPKSNIFELQILVAGKGTSLLSKIRKGETVQVLGPLGNNFTFPEKKSKVALLAGGIGVAPLIFFADSLTQKNIAFEFFYGAATKAALIPQNFLPNKVHFSTDDGSFGFKGFVTENFQSQQKAVQFDKIYACGPNLMLNEVKNIALNNKVDCELSIETIMACGIGICQGCVVQKNTKEHAYFLTCVDGPVFKAKDINL